MRFKRIYIEITNTCNLTCSFCIQNQRVPRRLSVDEFAHILKAVRPYTEYVYLHVLGEPLSHPHLHVFLQMLQEAGLQVNLTTNGTLLKAKEKDLQNVAIRQLNVSLHSFPQHYQTSYLSDVMAVCERLALRRIHVNYRLWALKDQRLDDATQAVLDMVCSHYHKKLAVEDVQRMQRIDIAAYLHLHFEQQFAWPSLSVAELGDKGRCLGMKTMLGILSNGDVVPCCLDSRGDICLGNIFVESLADILQKQRVHRMMEGFSKFRLQEPLCRHCGYCRRFQ